MPAGVAVALADKLETLVGLFGIGQLPTGDKDPFALRRHALGVIRMLMRAGRCRCDLTRPAGAGRGAGVRPARSRWTERGAVATSSTSALAGSLREQGYSAQEVDAVLAPRPQRLATCPSALAAVRAFAALPEAASLAAANKRVGNILEEGRGAGQRT